MEDEQRRSRAGKAGKAETGQPAARGRKTPSETSYGGERAGSVPVINMSLAQAIVSAEVLGRLAYLAGFNPSASPKSARTLLADFDWDKVPQEDIRIPEGLF